MKNLLLVIFLVALAILIKFLMEGFTTEGDMTNIIGCETDSVGNQYILFDNGDVYHRRKTTQETSSPVDSRPTLDSKSRNVTSGFPSENPPPFPSSSASGTD